MNCRPDGGEGSVTFRASETGLLRRKLFTVDQEVLSKRNLRFSSKC